MRDYEKLYATDYHNKIGYTVYQNKVGELIKIVREGIEEKADEKQKIIKIGRDAYLRAAKKYGFDKYYEHGIDAWKLCDELCTSDRGFCEQCGHPL